MTGNRADRPTRVLIVDDDATFRKTTGRLLTAAGYVCREAATGAQARQCLDGDGEFAVALCDLRMPGESGLDLLAHLAADFPEVAVVMTTGVDDPSTAAMAFGIGAYGYLIKPFTPNELRIALVGALHRRELEAARITRLRPTSRGLGSDLGPRELEVLRLMAAGLSNKVLARQLHLSLNTVRNHVQHVLEKLGAHSKLEAVATAVREGIIERDHVAVHG